MRTNGVAKVFGMPSFDQIASIAARAPSRAALDALGMAALAALIVAGFQFG